ncbi:MAG: amidohydrolase family protein, partial [Bacteroidales bacterium]|nr:amidohydrolase family protein [Bacteroidales bacterium]
MDRLLKGGTLIDAAGRRRGDVLIRDGRIAAIGPDIVEASGAQVVDCSGKWISAGFVDVHVHFREPGQSYKETIRTGSLAAAHGGYT